MSALSALASLIRASLEGAVLIGLVWLVCRLFPRLPAAVRCGLWWMACLKLLVGLVWIAPLRLPLLPAPPRAASSPARIVLQPIAMQTSPAPIATAEPEAPEPQGLAERGAPWASGLWLAGLVVISLRAGRQLRHTRWVIRRSETVGEG